MSDNAWWNRMVYQHGAIIERLNFLPLFFLLNLPTCEASYNRSYGGRTTPER